MIKQYFKSAMNSQNELDLCFEFLENIFAKIASIIYNQFKPITTCCRIFSSRLGNRMEL